MSLAALSFARPGWLLALLPLGLLLWRLWRARPDGAAAFGGAVDAHLLPHLLIGAESRARRGGLALLTAGVLLAVLALAGPAMPERQSAEAYRRDATRVLVVDLSPRMGALPATGMERVRLKLLDLLRALPEGQTALLVYAEEPYLVVPPTSDVEAIARFIPELAADVMPVAGNRPERALQMAAALLERSQSTARELVWITVGRDAGGAPLPKLDGARLSVLDVGSVDDAGLIAAAQRSGGTYLRLAGDDSDVRRLAATLGGRGGWVGGPGSHQAPDVGYWLLPPLLLLASLAFRRGVLMLLLAPLLSAGFLAPRPVLAFELAVPAVLADYAAWRRLQAGESEAPTVFHDVRWRAVASYRAGRFDEAAALLEPLGDADSRYNRGNALARQGRLVEALAAFDQALALRTDDEDIKFNRDLVQRLLNQQQNPSQGRSGGQPPPPQFAAQSAAAGGGAEKIEAARLAEQWLRGVPDEPGSLLRRKLQIEQRRRASGEAGQAW